MLWSCTENKKNVNIANFIIFMFRENENLCKIMRSIKIYDKEYWMKKVYQNTNSICFPFFYTVKESILKIGVSKYFLLKNVKEKQK